MKLTAEEETRVSEILNEIRSKVEKRRILTYPYFRDMVSLWAIQFIYAILDKYIYLQMLIAIRLML